ncbi:hypothetical protein MPSEU_000075800 [Mayamaea pseudoterrestris]|nr:hypothetical protein MPSEU_000075800 [Mayamaea pseudoterrestris]
MEAPVSLSPASRVTQQSTAPEGEAERFTDAGHDTNNALTMAQEETVRRFAALLSSDGKPAPLKDLSSLLASSVAEDSVILTLPLLDLRYAETDNSSSSSSSALPKIGEKKVIHNAHCNSSRPSMTASVLSGTNVDGAGGSLQVTDSTKASLSATTSHTKSTSWTKSTLAYASHALATNVTDFFSNLIDSRVKAWTLLLLRHSLSTGDTESRARLLGMLSTSILVQQATTNLKTLPMPSSAAGQRKEADVILPLLLEVFLQLSIQDKPSTIKLLAPGTISADFEQATLSPGALKKVVINLDTGIMLSCMIDQARLIVFKAVANVTKAKLPSSMSTVGVGSTEDHANTDSSSKEKPAKQGNLFHQAEPSPAPTRLTTGFKSSLGLSTLPVASAASPTLQKARNSALRLNSILLGKPDSQSKPAQLGMRKGRSVQWGSPAQIPTIAAPLATKKQRMIENAAKLTSIKSFGRPHGGDFGSGPRNATFGEYGQGVRMWGRDGRMAHHPLPMQCAVMDDQVGLTGIVERNATFDCSSAKTIPAMVAPRMGMGTASALPRTATGLENWLLKTSTASHKC